MKPKIVIENDVYQKVMHWVDKSTNEVSGFGNVVVEPDGVIRVISAMLLPQKNGPTQTEIKGDAVAKALFENMEMPGEMRWWWHSHPTFNVFWSATDHEAMRDFAGDQEENWIACTVFNQKRETRSAYYAPRGMKTPWGLTPLFWDECEFKISPVANANIAAWDSEYKENVTDHIETYKHKWSYDSRSSWAKQNDALANRLPVLLPGAKREVWDGKGGITTVQVPAGRGVLSRHLVKDLSNDVMMATARAKHAKDRPTGVSKRQWKHLRKFYQEAAIEAGIAAEVGVAEETQPEPTAGELVDGLQDWGYSIDEVQTLAIAGFGDEDIHELVSVGFDSDDIVELAEQEFSPLDIQDLLAQGLSAFQIMRDALDIATDPRRIQA